MTKHLACVVGLFGLLVFLTPSSAWAQDDPPQKAPSRASIGIAVEPTPRGAQQAGLTILDVMPDGPAAKAGLEAGDVVTKIGDHDVRTYDDLVNFIAKHKPGDKVTIHLIHSGKEETKTVTLGERPMGRREARMRTPGGRPSAFLGIQTAPLTPEAREKVREGVLVTEVMPDTPAAKAGLESGDVIASVNGKAVSDPDTLREMIRDSGVGKQVNLQVMRGGEKKEFKATLQEAPAEFRIGGPQARYGEAPFNPPIPYMIQDQQKIRQLERKIEQLEKRVRELEQKSGKSSSK